MAKLGYNIEEGKVPYSHSLSELWHSCPRKFQISVLNGHGREYKNCTLAYGHCVAAGIQAILDGKSDKQACIDMLLNWNMPLWDDDGKGHTFAGAKLAVEKFIALRKHILNGWEAAWFLDQKGNKRSGVEFDFKLIFPDGSSYQGHIDVILWHPQLKKFKILELKTTGRYREESYRNKGQTLGYSLIIDYIVDCMQDIICLSAEELEKVKAASDVLYLVYDIGQESYEQLPLRHSRLAKAEFLQSITLDILQIKSCQEINFFPKNGASCYSYGRSCDYFGSCDLASLRTPKPAEHGTFTIQDESEIAIVIPVVDVMAQQVMATQEEVSCSVEQEVPHNIPVITIDYD